MKMIKRVLAFLLMAAIVLPTAACEKKAKIVTDADRTESMQSGVSVQTTGISTGNPDVPAEGMPVVAGDVVSGDLAYYSSIEIELPVPAEGREIQMVDFCVNKDRIVFLMSEYTAIDWFSVQTDAQQAEAEQAYIDSQKHMLVSYDFDGNLINKTNLELGNIIKNTMTYIKSIFVNASDEVSLFVIQNHYESADNYQIFSVSEQGQIKDDVVTLIPSGSGSSANSSIAEVLGVGENLVSIVRKFEDNGSSSYDIVVYRAGGEELFRVSSSEMPGAAEFDDLRESVITDGTFVYIEEWFTRMIYKVDFTSQTLTPLSNNEYNRVMSGRGNLCVTDADGASYLDVNTGEAKQLFSWKNLDISLASSYLNASVMTLTEDRLLLKSSDYGNDPAQFLILKKEAVNPNQGKAIIRIGGMDVNYNPILQEAIYDFNRKSNSYRAELIEYRPDEYAESMEEYYAQYDAMNMRILSGDMPDVFVETNSYHNYISRYSSKNLFSDLYPFTENDSDFQRKNYYENILALPETGGQLPYIIPFYTLDGFFGKKEVLGNRTGWAFAEFEEFANQLPASMQLLKTGNGSQFLEKLAAGHMESLIDYTVSPAKANFDSDIFRQILQFSSTHGKSLSKMESMDVYEFEDMARNELALSYDSAYISRIGDFTYAWNRVSAPVTLIGYPSDSSSGPVCESVISVAIAADSPYQDAGWEFIKILLSEELQNEIASDNWGGYLPIHKGALETAISASQKETSGNQEGMGIGMGFGMEHSEPAYSADEWASTIKSIVASANVLSVRNQNIIEIISEESQAYFAGQKTMDDAISVIQSKVTTYLNEQ